MKTSGLGLLLIGGCAVIPTSMAPGVAAGGGGTQPARTAPAATEYTMPAVIGLAPAKVLQALRAAGHIGMVSFAGHSRDEFRGGVAEASRAPDAGEPLISNRMVMISFDVPSMSALVVPAVTGMNVPDAIAQLTASGIFDIQVEMSYDAGCRTDRVCQQSQPAGTAIPAHTTVDLIIGGPGNPAPDSEPAVAPTRLEPPPMREVVLPDVAGLSQVEAWKRLESVRFAGTVRFGPKNRDRAGEIVRADEDIDIDVPGRATRGVVPALTGMTAGDAIAALTAAGIVHINVFRGPDLGRDCEPGLVCDQDPAPGATRDAATITLGFDWR